APISAPRHAQRRLLPHLPWQRPQPRHLWLWGFSRDPIAYQVVFGTQSSWHHSPPLTFQRDGCIVTRRSFLSLSALLGSGLELMIPPVGQGKESFTSNLGPTAKCDSSGRRTC